MAFWNSIIIPLNAWTTTDDKAHLIQPTLQHHSFPVSGLHTIFHEVCSSFHSSDPPSRNGEPSPSDYLPINLSSVAEEPLIFEPQDAPPMPFWEKLADFAPEDLSIEDLHRIATRYVATALEPSSGSTWKGRLQRDHSIDPYMLHWTATVILNTPPSPLWKLAIHMLQTASDLDYAPSTITVLRVILMMTKGGPEASRYRSQFRNTLDKLGRLVQAGENPDAITLQGLLKVRSGNALKALKDFDAAIDAGRRVGDAYAPAPTKQRSRPGGSGDEDAASNQRAPQWMYEADCHVARGRILNQMGNREAALESFSIAALELDSPDGYLELGKNLPLGSPRREECLLKAAMSGKTEACPLLLASETAKSREAGEDKALVEEHLRWAAEWALLGRKIEEAGEDTVPV
ncbi:hypothetical protein B0T14DRAFT_494656 [Immersiella caudata]|uniref:Uncharacterized protein n=1 Tax=Immersiella caudata TaxID=314043 RepID=A0AA39WWZ4_9PEZI|nr:hypothetical protein B0T14DRAFT_494656 [Immersiella caudata]